jgi:hypothetical protein
MSVGPRKIFFVTQDAGGFRAVFPVYERMKKKFPRHTWGVFGDVAKQMAPAPRAPYVDPARVTDADLAAQFDRRPDLLVVGTSVGMSLEKRATAMARTRGIPVIAILDFWSNYVLRFSDPGTTNLAYLPDTILVMDQECKREMIQEGFDPKRIIVTGSPAFERFGRARRQHGTAIVFFSQPFSELRSQDSGMDFGFDEVQVFRDVISALEALRVTVPVIVKHHPRTVRRDVFSSIIKASSLDIREDETTPAAELIGQAAHVIGMNTVALFEAALAGASVLSYQPGLNRVDPLKSNRLRLSVPVYDQKRLQATIRRLMVRPRKSMQQRRVAARYMRGQATRKVIHYLQAILLS